MVILRSLWHLRNELTSTCSFACLLRSCAFPCLLHCHGTADICSPHCHTSSQTLHTNHKLCKTGVPNCPSLRLLPLCRWPGLHSRRWAVGKQVKIHLYLQPLPMAHRTAWALPSVRRAAALDCRGVQTLLCTAQVRDPEFMLFMRIIPKPSSPQVLSMEKFHLPPNRSLVPKRLESVL